MKLTKFLVLFILEKISFLDSRLRAHGITLFRYKFCRNGGEIRLPRGTYWPSISRLKSLASLVLVFVLLQEAHGQNNDARITDGLIAYYPFIEGSGLLVTDLSGVDSTLNLTISGDNVTWLTGRNGVSIDSSSIISSIGPASKLFREIVNNGAFSIEIWCKTSDLTQSGPARLVSYSGGPSLRNVTMGQAGLSIQMRLRTTTTTLNGLPTMAADSVVTKAQSHYVVTYSADGDERFFVNGSELISEPRAGDLSNWNSSYPLIIGNELTEDRPWLGEVYLVAIYNRELSQTEINQNFSAGSVVATGNREPEMPTLVSPDNGALFNSSSPPLKLKWVVPKDGDNDPLHFRIEIAQDTSFSSATIIESRIEVAGFVPTPPVASGQDTASYSLPSVLADGQYWWRVSAWDSLVYGAPSLPNSFIVDRTPPTGTLARSASVSLTEDFEVNWSRGTDSGSGLSGLYDVRVQVDGGPWMVWQSSFPDTFSIYNGQHEHTYGFEAAAHDSAGNIELFSQVAETITFVDTVANDVTAPGPPLSLTASGSNPGLWQNTPSFQISWVSPTDRSGIDRALYKLGSPPTANFDTTGSVTNTSTLNVNATQEDGQSFHLWLQDGEGNLDYRNRESVALLYDGTTPVIHSLSITNADFANQWINQKRTSLAQVNVRYDEKHMKLLSLESVGLNTSISLEQIPSGPNISFNVGLSIQNKADGLHELQVTLLDSAGNTAGSTTNLGLDSTPPTGTQASSPDTSTSRDFVVTWTGSGTDNDGSGLSGAYDVRYQVDDGSWRDLAVNVVQTSITFQGEQKKTYGFEVVAHDNVGNVEPFSGEAESVTVVDTGFVDIDAPTIAHLPLTLVNEGEDVIISADILDNSQIAQAVVFYKQSGKEVFQAAQMTQTIDNTYSVTIPASEVSIFGLNYYIQAWDGTNFSYFPQTDWETMPINLSVRIAGVNSEGLLKNTTQPGGEESSFYRMISIPINLTNKNPLAVLEDDLGPYDAVSWRLFQYQTSTATYAEYPNISSLGPGVAVWLIVRDPNKQIDSGIGSTLTSNTPFEITLEQGWNDFGIPFTFPVDWNDIQVISSSASDVMGPYTYQGQWILPNQVSTLFPWEGYSVFSQNSGVRLAIPPKQSAASQAVVGLSKESTELDWFVGIESSVGTLLETSTYLGVAQEASNTWDKFDYLQPPYIADFISTHFAHAEWQEFSENFTTDIRPPFSDGQVWHFEVTTNIPETVVKLDFTNLISVPKDFKVILRDNSNFQERDISQLGEYTFMPEQNKLRRQFDLVIGTSDYLENADQTEELQPETFSLSQNFPNPFNAGTSFYYQIAELSQIRITVLNILGQQVRRLLSDQKAPGRYRVNWDGKGDNGLEMGSGIYIIQLEAGKFQQTRKMILLR